MLMRILVFYLPFIVMSSHLYIQLMTITVTLIHISICVSSIFWQVEFIVNLSPAICTSFSFQFIIIPIRMQQGTNLFCNRFLYFHLFCSLIFNLVVLPVFSWFMVIISWCLNTHFYMHVNSVINISRYV